MWLLSGIVIIVIGFVVGLNPLLVVTIAGFVTGLIGHLDIVAIISALGKSFVDSRSIGLIYLIIPVIGLLERAGLREQAQRLVSRVSAATTGRILLVYLLLRQLTAALGLTTLGGHAQMVRPLIAPMAEAAAETKLGPISDKVRFKIRAFSAATDNVGVFFGEDIFIAIGSILLIHTVLQQQGVNVEPIDLAMWAIPTAVLAFIIHGTRLLLLDRQLKRQVVAEAEAAASASQTTEAGR
ncbi:MAG TPA: DUF969 domain-containing protein [Magnetospirillaceae bacterium]|jgi:uncharacterized membrane protein